MWRYRALEEMAEIEYWNAVDRGEIIDDDDEDSQRYFRFFVDNYVRDILHPQKSDKKREVI